MIQLRDFEEAGAKNDRVIQMALREIDMSVLAQAFVLMDETERQIVYRNMSKRAAALLADEVEQENGRISQMTSRKSHEFFLQKLKKYREYLADKPWTGTLPDMPPALDTSTESAIIDTFSQVVRFARARGNLALEGIDLSAADLLARKGMQFVVDGWDPLFARSILERMKDTLLADYERKLSMILEGIDSLMSGDVHIATEERLRAHVSESERDA